MYYYYNYVVIPRRKNLSLHKTQIEKQFQISTDRMFFYVWFAFKNLMSSKTVHFTYIKVISWLSVHLKPLPIISPTTLIHCTHPPLRLIVITP